jgi:hypothetical protein
MKRRTFLESIIPTIALSCSTSEKRIILSVDDILKRGDYIGNIDESRTYKLPIGEKGRNIALQMIDYQTGKIYSDLSQLDSLEFKETISSVNGMSIYNITRIVEKR